MLILGRRRLIGAGNALDVVAADCDEPMDALRPERGCDTGGSSALVVASQSRGTDVQGVEQSEQISA